MFRGLLFHNVFPSLFRWLHRLYEIELIHGKHQIKGCHVIYSFVTYHRICNQINTTDATRGTGTFYPSGAPDLTPEFQWGSCYPIFSFMCMFCRLLFVPVSFLIWPLCFLFFGDIWILITPLVSSNSSYGIECASFFYAFSDLILELFLLFVT